MTLQVTEPFLPPFEEYRALLEGVWERNHLTNHGPLLVELERGIPEKLGSVPMHFLGNGTLALQLAMRALDVKDEVITTPFSYVATTSSIVWEGCTPVFVDIDPLTLNIDPSRIEEAITPRTSAILATHVFGNPCDVMAIQEIADAHGLKVIYDAAHAFGTRYKGKSIMDYGDMSAVSFHATKLFHTVEGGGVFSRDEEAMYRITRLRNFGHKGPVDFDGLGINAKNSEFHAAMGIVNLGYIDDILQKRKSDSALYDDYLDTNHFYRPLAIQGAEPNRSYYPIILESKEVCLTVDQSLRREDIHPRRYFYPSLDTLEYVTRDKELINATRISKQILCLPLSYGLSAVDIERVARVVNHVLRD